MAVKRAQRPPAKRLANITVTNPDKLMYPAAGVTKAAVVDYYARIAPVLLPHLRQRPVTMKRFPDGVTGPFFYEKDAPSFTPSWVTTFPVPRSRGGRDIQYIVVNDARTLAWCANLASLELHPFLHRVPSIDRPTSVVFDLDPGPGTDVLTCGRVAMLLKQLFVRLGLKCFVKVSGSKGLQVYLPLNTRTSYATTQPFARTVAEWLESEHPALIVSDMAKSRRTGKVFIDWSQNADHKTTVSVYSLRAKQSHPFVSLPVSWPELEGAISARDARALAFSPDATHERLAAHGDLFAPVLRLKQEVPTSFKRMVRTRSVPRGR
jgi:bifunctional non-homologous end joining protein LigD